MRSIADRLAIAIVGNSLEWQIGEPARRLQRQVEPAGVLGRVAVNRAVRLPDAAFSRDESVVRALKVDALMRPEGLVDFIGEPLAQNVVGGRVQAERIVLLGEHGQRPQAAALFRACGFDRGTERACVGHGKPCPLRDGASIMAAALAWFEIAASRNGPPIRSQESKKEASKLWISP